MINITKEKLFRSRFAKVSKMKKNTNIFKQFVGRNKAIMLLVASFILLAISNGFLVYNFFRIISKI